MQEQVKWNARFINYLDTLVNRDKRLVSSRDSFLAELQKQLMKGGLSEVCTRDGMYSLLEELRRRKQEVAMENIERTVEQLHVEHLPISHEDHINLIQLVLRTNTVKAATDNGVWNAALRMRNLTCIERNLGFVHDLVEDFVSRIQNEHTKNMRDLESKRGALTETRERYERSVKFREEADSKAKASAFEVESKIANEEIQKHTEETDKMFRDLRQVRQDHIYRVEELNIERGDLADRLEEAAHRKANFYVFSNSELERILF